MERLNCVILAAGKGTRMRSKLSRRSPTPSWAGRWSATSRRPRRRSGRRRSSSSPATAGESSRPAWRGPDVTFAHQTDQKGTAHALLYGRGAPRTGDILVLYGDVPLIKASTLAAFVDFFRPLGRHLLHDDRSGRPLRLRQGDRRRPGRHTSISSRTARPKATCAE